MTENQIRQRIVETGIRLLQQTPDAGPDIHISLRWSRGKGDGLLVTPAAGVSSSLTTNDLKYLLFDNPDSSDADWQARLHQSLTTTQALINTSAEYAALLASLPQVQANGFGVWPASAHPRIGSELKCAAVSPDADQQASNIRAALGDGTACLLANDGLIVTGSSVEQAGDSAGQAERAARLFWRRSLGMPGL